MLDEKLLIEALKLNDEMSYGKLTEEVEPHKFSKKFEKKMNRLMRTNNYFGGHQWLERSVRYVATAAAVVACFMAVNFTAVKAFNVDIWQTVVEYGKDYLGISFEKNEYTEEKGSQNLRFDMAPEGYEKVDEEITDETVTQFFDKDGKNQITYLQTLADEGLQIELEIGTVSEGEINNWSVNYVERKDYIGVYFIDDKYTHTLIVEGIDANKEYVNKILKQLKEH